MHRDPGISKRPGLGLTLNERLDLYTDKSGSCWLWTGGGERYGKTNDGKKTVSAHVASYERHVGPVPPGMLVRHACDTPKCVKPQHLLLGTSADNSKDMTTRERQARGIKQWCAKMTDKSVVELRRDYASGTRNIPQLSAHYGLSLSTVGKIIHRQTWKHV